MVVKRLLLLITCTAGILIPYTQYGIFQEKMCVSCESDRSPSLHMTFFRYRQGYGGGERFREHIFGNYIQCIFNSLVSLIGSTFIALN